MSRACAPDDQPTPCAAVTLPLFDAELAAALPTPAHERIQPPRAAQAPRERRWPEAPAGPVWLLREPAPGLTPGPGQPAAPAPRRSKARIRQVITADSSAGTAPTSSALTNAAPPITATALATTVHRSTVRAPRSGPVVVPGWIDAVPTTQLLSEPCTSVLRVNDAPALPFALSLNPYRGCAHACVLCPVAPQAAAHETGPQALRVTVHAKTNVADRLRLELRRPGYRPRPICLGSAADAYQPAERQQRLTRTVVEVLAEARHPFGLTTRSAGVVRDLDLFAPLAEQGLVLVLISLASPDPLLCARLEPGASPPALRLAALRSLARAGVWVGLHLAPLVPGLNDGAELETLIHLAAQAGARAVRWQPAQATPAAPAAHFRAQAAADGAPAGDAEWRAALDQRIRTAAAQAGLGCELPNLDCSRFQPPQAPHSPAERAPAQKALF
jgi:DNA repair photolyase